MTERGPHSTGKDQPTGDGGPVRLVWQDGPFRLECVGRMDALRLRVFEAGELQAEESVSSAEAAYQRGREICARIIRTREREYGRDSA